MNVKCMRKSIIFLIFILLMSICCTDSKGSFEVIVYSSECHPIAGATIEGGIDWDWFSVQTDNEGLAILPGYARGQAAIISRTNFYPYEVKALRPGFYKIESTPRKLKLISEVNGVLVNAVKFGPDMIATIDYHGNYHVYEYNDNELNEISSALLPGSIRYFKLYNDTLWLSTHGEGFYVYSLQDLQQPQQICHLDIPGYNSRPFAVGDTILAVGLHEGPLRIFSFGYDGQYQELASIGNFWVNEMTFISHYLIVVGHSVGSSNTPIVFDMQDPANPQLVYTGSESELLSCFLYKNYLVMQPYLYESGPVEYRLLDLSNPANPYEQGTYSTEAHLIDIIDDSIAVGSYTASVTVLTGGVFSGFDIVVTVSEGSMLDEFSGSYPPYFIIAHNLWKLED